MKSTELRAIAKVMDECGIVFLKTSDIELHRDPLHKRIEEPKAFHVEQIKIPVDAPTPAEDKIEHKTVELTSVMKLSDTDLVDKLFPDYTTEEEAS